MNFRKQIVSCLLIIAILLPGSVLAQESQPKLQLGLIRNFGYGGLGEIQGRFTLKINDPPEQLSRVEYFLDDQLVAARQDPPFEYKFHTGDFQDGRHIFTAVGYQKDGTKLEANSISKTFLSSDQAWEDTQSLIVPLLLFTAGLTLLGLGIPVLMSRKRDFVVGTYGPAGGAVCPRCELPFSRSIFAPNLLVGKLVRCPHCGRTSIQARASLDLLQEAESRYSNTDPEQKKKQTDQDFIKQIEESRFED